METHLPRLSKHWPDLGYLALVTHRYTHAVTFDVYRVSDSDGNGEPLAYVGECGPVEDIASAMAVLRAFVKWDGCCDLRLAEAFHCCSVTEAAAIGELIRRLYALAAELLPQHADTIMGS